MLKSPPSIWYYNCWGMNDVCSFDTGQYQYCYYLPNASTFQQRGKRPSVVFVVDDEEVIASTLAEILKMHGYSATFFTSPREALAAIRLRAPDLLITDVIMPGISGVDLATRVQSECPKCEVLLFSGHARSHDLLEGHDFQMLEKPVLPTAILSHVAKSSLPTCA